MERPDHMIERLPHDRGGGVSRRGLLHWGAGKGRKPISLMILGSDWLGPSAPPMELPDHVIECLLGGGGRFEM